MRSVVVPILVITVAGCASKSHQTHTPSINAKAESLFVPPPVLPEKKNVAYREKSAPAKNEEDSLLKKETKVKRLALQAQLDQCEAQLKKLPQLVSCLNDLIPIRERMDAIQRDLKVVQDEGKARSLKSEFNTLETQFNDTRKAADSGETRMLLEEERLRILDEMQKLESE